MSLHDLAKCIRELTWEELETFADECFGERGHINNWAKDYLEGVKPQSADCSPDQKPEPDSDGWIPHDGKSIPVDGDVLVDVKFRDGTSRGEFASVWIGSGVTNWWLWEGHPHTNIIAWRYSK